MAFSDAACEQHTGSQPAASWQCNTHMAALGSAKLHALDMMMVRRPWQPRDVLADRVWARGVASLAPCGLPPGLWEQLQADVPSMWQHG